MDASTRAAIRRRVDAEKRRRVPLPGSPGARSLSRANECWEAAGGDPLLALILALDTARLRKRRGKVEGVSSWLLSCGHTVPMLEHDRPDEPPRRPRMCPLCRKPRNVERPGSP